MAEMTLAQLQALVEQQGAELAKIKAAAAATTPAPTEYYTLAKTGEEIDEILAGGGGGGVEDAVRYGTAQALTADQQTQARINIGAAVEAYYGGRKQNGTLIQSNLSTKGWYRIAAGSFYSGGILTIQHHFGSGGPSSLKFLVTMDPHASSIKCLEYTNWTSSRITNARIVKDAANNYYVDVYYNITYMHMAGIDFISTGRVEAVSQTPVYIAEDDTLPDGETLMAPMEYFNPPMALGVEYRTTERYQGKPVYCKLVNFGVLPNNTTKAVAHSIENLQKVISLSGEAGGANLIGNMYVTYCHVDTSNITIKTNADRSSVAATALIKYTKTT